jgi:hypothetical protein
MGLLRLSTPGFDYQAQQTITQVPIALTSSGALAASNNIMTITTPSAHGLTLNPSAGVPPNYFVTFGGTSSGITGTGILVGNIFRILAIPSTTTFTIYGTLTAATITSNTVIPVFFPNFQASPASLYSGPQPTMTVSAVTTSYPPPSTQSAFVYAQLGANAVIRINSDNTFSLPLDAFTTPAAGTPATAPVWTTVLAASVSGALAMMGYTSAVWASGSSGTSTFSVLN